MKIFLSYSFEDKKIAEEVNIALAGAGHKVFFGHTIFPPGSDFHSRIAASIEESEFYIFLVSPHSVKKGCYTLSELELAKKEWPKPWGFVLPVIIKKTDAADIDPYLGAVAFLKPAGNIAAEVVAALKRRGIKEKKKKHLLIPVIVIILFTVTYMLTRQDVDPVTKNNTRTIPLFDSTKNKPPGKDTGSIPPGANHGTTIIEPPKPDDGETQPKKTTAYSLGIYTLPNAQITVDDTLHAMEVFNDTLAKGTHTITIKAGERSLSTKITLDTNRTLVFDEEDFKK